MCFAVLANPGTSSVASERRHDENGTSPRAASDGQASRQVSGPGAAGGTSRDHHLACRRGMGSQQVTGSRAVAVSPPEL